MWLLTEAPATVLEGALRAAEVCACCGRFQGPTAGEPTLLGVRRGVELAAEPQLLRGDREVLQDRGEGVRPGDCEGDGVPRGVPVDSDRRCGVRRGGGGGAPAVIRLPGRLPPSVRPHVEPVSERKLGCCKCAPPGLPSACVLYGCCMGPSPVPASSFGQAAGYLPPPGACEEGAVRTTPGGGGEAGGAEVPASKVDRDGGEADLADRDGAASACTLDSSSVSFELGRESLFALAAHEPEKLLLPLPALPPATPALRFRPGPLGGLAGAPALAEDLGGCMTTR